MKLKIFTHSLKPLFILLFGMLLGEVGWGQTSITAIGTAVNQNFDGLTTSTSYQTWTDNSTITGWYAKTDATSPSQYKANTGGNTTASLYSFGSTSVSDRAFGYVPSDAFTGVSGKGNGYMGWRLKNNTGKSIGSIQIIWTGEQWRKAIDANIQYITLSYQVGSTVTDLTSGTYILTNSTFASPIHDATAAITLDGNLSANRTAGITIDINVVIPAGEEIMLRWADLNDPANHTLAIDDVSFTATKESQTITFNTLASKTFGDPAFDLTATASSGLTVSYASSNTSVSTISGNTVTLTGAGTTTITASQPGNGTFAPAIPVDRVLTVKPQAPTATAATNSSASSFSANWGSASGAAGYYLYYGTDPTLATYTAASVGLVTTFNLTGLIPGTPYYYRLKSINTGIYSDYSNIIEVTTGAGVQTYDITAVPSFTGVTLTWTKGNLSSRAVFVKEGTGTITNPDNNNRYYESTNWNIKGDQLGSSGYYCVYYGTGTTVDLTNLYPGRLYSVQAFEFNGAEWEEIYLTSVSGANNPNTFTTWGTTTFTNAAGVSIPEDWTNIDRWDHAIVPTAALHSAVLVYIDGNCEITTTAVSNNLTIKAAHGGITPELSINPNQSLTVTGALTNSAGTSGLVIKSDATGTGSLMHNTTNVDATIERYISGTTDLSAKKYHLVSVPVNASTYLSAVWVDSYLFTYLEPTNTWFAWDDPMSNVLQTKEGAMVYYPFGSSKIYSITGQLNNGTYTPTVAYTGSDKGYNLVPNPYPSAIDWNAVSGWTKTHVTGTIYGFSPTAKNYGSWNGSDGTNSMTRYIPAGQGFFVVADASSPSLTMTNSVRVNNTTGFLKSNSLPPNIFHLTAAGNGGQDEIAVQFAYDATTSATDTYDAEKLYGDLTVPQLSSFTANDATPLSITGLPFDQSSTAVPLKLEMTYTGEVIFTASAMESFQSGTSIKLEDKQLTRMIDLRTNPVYTFNHTPQDATDRFVLHFGSVLGIDTPETRFLSNVFVSGREIYLDYPASTNGELITAVYDMQGRTINQFHLNGTGHDHFTIRTSGVYVVKLMLPGGIETHKIVAL